MATLREIRRSVGYNLDGIDHGAMVVRRTTAVSTDAAIIHDSTIRQQNLDGFWFVSGGSGALSGVIRRIIGNDVSGGTLTLQTALPALAPADMEYEVWDQKIPPAGVHDRINQSITEANERTYVPVMRDNLFIGRQAHNFEIPQDFDYVREIHYMSPFLPGMSGEGIWWCLAGEGIGSPPDGSEWEYSRLGVHLLSLPVAGLEYAVQEPSPGTIGYSHVAAVVYGTASDAGIAITIGGEVYRETNVGLGWRYVTIPLQVLSATEIETINLRSTGVAPILLYMVALIQEEAVRWRKASFTIPPGGGRAYLGALFDDYVRLRIHGGKNIEALEADAAELSINPAFIIKKTTALSLVSLGREDPDSTLYQQWAQQARFDYFALPTSGNRIRVRR